MKLLKTTGKIVNFKKLNQNQNYFRSRTENPSIPPFMYHRSVYSVRRCDGNIESKGSKRFSPMQLPPVLLVEARAASRPPIDINSPASSGLLPSGICQVNLSWEKAGTYGSVTMSLKLIKTPFIHVKGECPFSIIAIHSHLEILYFLSISV